MYVYSNIIDLAMFAKNNGNNSLPAMIDSIVTSVSGEDRLGAVGLSFYYPLADDNEVKNYMLLSSNNQYNDFLQNIILRKIQINYAFSLQIPVLIATVNYILQ